MDFSLAISPGPDNCANPFRNNIFSAYICHPIGYDEFCLVSKYVFLWSYMCIFRFINYECVPRRVKYNMFWVLCVWVDYMVYPILCEKSVDKGCVFGVEFWWFLSCIETGFLWFWFIPPGYALFLEKNHMVVPSAILYWHWGTCIANVKIDHWRLGWLLRQRRGECKIHLEAYLIFIEWMCMDLNDLDVCSMCSCVEFIQHWFHIIVLLLDL